MLKTLFAQKNQSKLILITALVVVAMVVFAFAGKSEIITDGDSGAVTIQRSIFGIKIGK